ncbi:hypothetical protein HCEG_04329 [Histoplasma capsulatum var. duboisii H88]|uniref:Uncharacterized protein n=1 Tax=Ajellomyces capsulatus (strain H88) TaxID=544711 RepID=F0UGH2_AJEC8|nr:hypothetical protein HCEG_04329 [Histoplasma capsulatum var. duboisii H88]
MVTYRKKKVQGENGQGGKEGRPGRYWNGQEFHSPLERIQPVDADRPCFGERDKHQARLPQVITYQQRGSREKLHKGVDSTAQRNAVARRDLEKKLLSV